MEATQEPVQSGHSSGPGAPPMPTDPIHDIDGKKTVIWLVFWIILLGVGLWLLLVVFKLAMFEERRTRFEDQKSPELSKTTEQQNKILAGQPEGSTTQGMGIKEAMKRVSGGARPENHK